MKNNLQTSSKVVVKNTLFNTISGITVQVLSMITGIIIARKFGAAGYGKLAFASVFVTYFMMATDFGMTAIAIRNVARDKGSTGKFLSTYVITRALMSSVIYIVILAVVYFYDFEKIVVFLILAYALQMFSQIFNVSWVFVAHQRMEYDGAIKIVEKILYVGLIVVLIFISTNPLIVPLSILISSAVTVIVGWVMFTKYWGRIRFSFDRPFFKEIILFSWPIGLSNAATRVNDNMDTLFMTGYHGSVVTGLYSSAYRIVSVLVMAGAFFTSALYPLLCERVAGPREKMERVLEISTKLLFYLILPITVFFTLFGSRILSLVFGHEFEQGGVALQILSWSVIFLLTSRLYGNVLVALNKQHYFTAIVVISAGINVLMNFLLIPRYAMVGGGIATCVTEIFIFLSSIYLLARWYKFPYLRSFMIALISSTIMGGCLYLLQDLNLALLLLLAPVPYLFCAYILGGLGRTEILFIKGFFKKDLSEKGVV